MAAIAVANHLKLLGESLSRKNAHRNLKEFEQKQLQISTDFQRHSNHSALELDFQIIIVSIDTCLKYFLLKSGFCGQFC